MSLPLHASILLKQAVDQRPKQRFLKLLSYLVDLIATDYGAYIIDIIISISEEYRELPPKVPPHEAC
jgi:hypothetical protein